MIEDLARSLAAALPDCTADEIADVLWLVTARYEPPEAPLGVQQGAEAPVPLRSAEPAAGPEAAAEAIPDAGRSELLLAPGASPALGGRMVPAAAVGLRVPAATRQVSTGRILAPFRRVQRPGPLTVDVDATVEATADARRLVIVTRPGRERGLDVALVIDTSLVTTVRRSELNEFEAQLRRAGAFRSVTRWTLAPGPGEHPLIHDIAGVTHHPDRLLDPSGRRLVLLATDAVAEHWYRPALWHILSRWAQAMPTAVIHVLPEQYRARTALGGSAIMMKSRRPAAPNDVADVRTDWWDPDAESADGRADVPVPVISLRPEALTIWTQAIAVGTAWADAIWARPPQGPAPREANAHLSAADRVRAFRSTASRGAQALARVLAWADELTLPLIALLQARVLPGTGSSELAEVFIAGLLERDTREGPDRDGYFRFRPGVGELLRQGTTMTQEWDTIEAVSEYLEQNAGTGDAIHALQARPDGSAEASVDLEPFAALRRSVAARLGLLPDGHTEADPGAPPAQEQPPAQKQAPKPSYGGSRPMTSSAPGSRPPAPRPPAPRRPDSPAAEGRPADGLPARRPTWLPRLPARRLVCPFCYSSITERQLQFRCTGWVSPSGRRCDSRIDETRRDWAGSADPLPPVFSADGRSSVATCPTCGGNTSIRICPVCHATLPPSFGKVDSRLIAVVGGTAAGKSVFLTVLIHELMRRVGNQFNASIIADDDATRERFDSDYERPLYRDRFLSALPKLTQAAYRQPLVFRITTEKRRRLGTAARQQTLLSIYDTAGEDMGSRDHVSLLASYLAAADGIVLLLDPLQMPGARSLARPGTQMPLPIGHQPAVLLTQVTQLLRSVEGRRPGGGVISKPLAIAFTKLDALRHDLDESSPLRRPAPQAPYFDETDSSAVHDQIRQMLDRWDGPQIDMHVRANYQRFRYFGLSALGDPPTSDNTVSPAGIQPYRVADPLLWLLSEFGAITKQRTS